MTSKASAGSGIPFRSSVPTDVIDSVPNTPSRHAEGVSNDEFRAAMSRLADGVVLVTAREPSLDPDDPRAPDGEDVGMTATAFVSTFCDSGL